MSEYDRRMYREELLEDFYRRNQRRGGGRDIDIATAAPTEVAGLGIQVRRA